MIVSNPAMIIALLNLTKCSWIIKNLKVIQKLTFSIEEEKSDEEIASPTFTTNPKFKRNPINQKNTGVHIDISALNQEENEEEKL